MIRSEISSVEILRLTHPGSSSKTWIEKKPGSVGMLYQFPPDREGAELNPTDFHDIREIILRLGIATLLGGILGIDRDLHRKPAGVRVLALVAMGAGAITMVSVVAVTAADEKTVADGVLRTVQGVLSGIGFLGAGVIMRAQGKDEVHGLTTAASIWVSAILGMICGLGQWALGFCGFALAWIILQGGRQVELMVLRFAPPPLPPAPEIIGVENKTTQ